MKENIVTYEIDGMDKKVLDLREKNKNLSESLSTLIKKAKWYRDGDGTYQDLEQAIEDANDTLIGNSVVLIDFPSFLKKKYPNRNLSTEEVIEIYKFWNQ